MISNINRLFKTANTGQESRPLDPVQANLSVFLIHTHISDLESTVQRGRTFKCLHEKK